MARDADSNPLSDHNRWLYDPPRNISVERNFPRLDSPGRITSTVKPEGHVERLEFGEAIPSRARRDGGRRRGHRGTPASSRLVSG